ncbi:MAG: HAMP domain-containing histidine kinase [Streptosporangiaceae bacterium]|nr:HAMP domain-containing histidine kinase [Streptosporangiaceae bacterium]
MGVVSTLVLRNLEEHQFHTDLALTAKQSIEDIATATNGYGAAYYNFRQGSTGALDLAPISNASSELAKWLHQMLAAGQLKSFITQNPPGTQFSVAVPGYTSLTATFRMMSALQASAKVNVGLLPQGRNLLVIGRPDTTVGSQVRGVILAELLTGGILLALLAVGGRWLIGRGLAPLDSMASTADMITSQGDLSARMPDPSDHAEAGRLAAAINTMLDRIQQAFVARYQSEQKVRQFAADASHELRTPLTTIRGYAELYRQGALGETELPNAMRRIEQEADRMSSLVAELLELARLDRMTSLDLTETDLSELVRDAVADARAVEPGRPVSAQAPPNFVIVADEPRIRQVLANLLGNVREHTPPDTAVTVRLVQAGHGALLEVTDAGPGMPADAAARAFDRFYRGPRGNGSGSGLGLSIVQAIAAAHGGHAMLRSRPGAGTIVQVWIPFRTEDNERTAAQPLVYT